MKKDEFRVSLGPVSVGVCTNARGFTEQLIAYYRQFVTDQAPLITLEVFLLEGEAEVPLVPKVSPHRIEFDQVGYRGVVDWNARTAHLQLGVRNPLFGVDYFLRIIGALAAESIGGLMVHAAGVEREGRAYLFLGPSGAGKTTTARNSPPGSVLNDDLIVLYRSGERWFAAATPFHNPSQNRPRQGWAPLTKILYLVKDVSVYLEPVPPARALAEMLACVPILTLEPFYLKGFVERCQGILRSVPYSRLHLLPDASYWEVVLER